MTDREINSTQKLILTALMAAMVMVMTFIIRVPIPATQGYIHLGDCMIFMAVIILGWKYGALAAAIGSGLADIVGGYAFYAPITFIVKGLMAIVAGLFINWAVNKIDMSAEISNAKQIVVTTAGMVLGGLTMVGGYYLAESIMYGNFITPIVAIPMNCLQFVVGVVLALALAAALEKTSLGSRFAYRIRSSEVHR